LQDTQNTLQDDKVDVAMSAIVAAATGKLVAKLRG